MTIKMQSSEITNHEVEIIPDLVYSVPNGRELVALNLMKFTIQEMTEKKVV